MPPDASIEPEQRLLDAIGPSTRVVSVSWVRYQDGVRLDLAKLGRGCRERGVHLVVDGIQGAGTMVPSFEGVSAFATGGHKGLLGLQGQGLLWTDPVFRESLMPVGTWLSAPDAFSQSGTQAAASSPWAADGRRLEAGSPSILSCAALASSIQILLDHGCPRRALETLRGQRDSSYQSNPKLSLVEIRFAEGLDFAARALRHKLSNSRFTRAPISSRTAR